MRILKYRLEDGNLVDSYSNALASGTKFDCVLEDVDERPAPEPSPIRAEMMKHFGYVSPTLINKVTIA